MVALGVLGWATNLQTSMVVSGVGMALLVFAGVLIVRKRTRSPRRDDADTPLSGEASAGAKAAAAGMDRK